MHQYKDQEAIHYVNTLSYSDLMYYTKFFRMVDLKHYLSIQLKWLEEEKYLLGTKIHKSPNDIELISDWNKHHNSERYRAYYVLRYPEKVEKFEPEYHI